TRRPGSCASPRSCSGSASSTREQDPAEDSPSSAGRPRASLRRLPGRRGSLRIPGHALILHGGSSFWRGTMRLRALIFGASLVVLVAASAAGQGFQGGLRGSIKDSGGVV